MELNLGKITKAHFIGIGGIGVSALARMMMLRGIKVSGSDDVSSEIISELESHGTKIFLGHAAEHVVPDTSFVIYTLAIAPGNPELTRAMELGIPSLSYPEALGQISRDYYTIAISGTHGKTTTTGMVAKILKDAGLDPTVVVGSILKDEKSNFIAGKGKHLVVEACEYKRSFLNLYPTIAAITNIDDDHLDYYKDLSEIEGAFADFASKVPPGGFLICDTNDERLKVAMEVTRGKVVDYTEFTDKKLPLKVPGFHNISNAAVALAVAHILKIDKKQAKKSLESFAGTWRRFEFKGETKNGTLVYDDYGHHPTEIKATLRAAREKFGNKKIIVVFQPHLYSRTKLLLNDFVRAFSDADEVLLAPMYAGREQNDPSVSSEILASKMQLGGKEAKAFPDFASIEASLKETLAAGDVLMTMGAGDVYKAGEALLR